jgi:hypothetical protein
MSDNGGHPALGSSQAGGVGNSEDRYVIAAFTMPVDGPAFITDSFYRDVGSGGPSGAQVLVHVNGDAPTFDQLVPVDGGIAFNHFVGDLSAGDTIYVSFGPDGNAGSDSFEMDFSVLALNVQTTVVADYRDDFSDTGFPDGWQYLWNAPQGWPGATQGDTNPIGDPANYQALQWGGGRWSPDGDGTNGNNQPAGYARLSDNGGHPALGSTQAGGVGNAEDRYVIAAYTLEADGLYALTDTSFSRPSGSGNGDELLVHINDEDPLYSRLFSPGATGSFNILLGELSAGDTVYVAVGPNGAAGSDGFEWDFSITRFNAVPEPATISLLLIGLALLGLYRCRR